MTTTPPPPQAIPAQGFPCDWCHVGDSTDWNWVCQRDLGGICRLDVSPGFTIAVTAREESQ